MDQLNPPEAETTIVLQQFQEQLQQQQLQQLQQLQLVLAKKDQQIRDTKSQQLYDYCWVLDNLPDDLHALRVQRSVDAVVDDTGNHIYFRIARSQPSQVCQYDVASNKWTVHTCMTKYVRYSMIHHDNRLIMIGGAISNDDKAERISKIIAIDEQNQPQSIYCSMPTGRGRTTALKLDYNGHVLLIVIGGEDDNDETLKTVEILNLSIPNGTWQRARDIPGPIASSSATIVNGFIYLLGGWSKRDQPSASVYRCNVEALIATALPGNNMGQVWETLPDLPVEEAACTSFKGHLMVVGGKANKVAVRDIRTYNEDKNRWDVIGYLPNPRYNCFAVGLEDKLIIFGGLKYSASNENNVDIYIHGNN